MAMTINEKRNKYKYSGDLKTGYSNHLNAKNLNPRQYGCQIFKWLSNVNWRTIRIPDILNHKQAFFNPASRPPFKFQTI